MDKPLRHNIEQKMANTKYMQYDSIDINFKNKQN